MPIPSRTTRDLPPPPGVTLTNDGAEFCVFAGHADAVWVCLFEADDALGTSERRIPLTERAYGYWFGTVAGVRPGQRYGFRAAGPWSPRTGLRYNENKLLLDPYARSIHGEPQLDPALFGHAVSHQLIGDTEVMDTRDSAPFVPRGVVVDEEFDWGQDQHPDTSLADSVIYECHVRNVTRRLPGIPDELRGTYAGLAHPATIAHLKHIGVTAVELLPVHTFASEPRVISQGLVNHWGYNTMGFFAPHAPYAAADDPQGVLDEFKGMVKLLHAEGIEVLLDVVYNHTAEANSHGPTLSWRGLDNRVYYRLDERGHSIDVTGCGNTVDTRQPVTCQMVLDSLRYWVTQCHVDGFRFDLAVALGRGRDDGYDPDHPFLMALRADPVLGRTKLIAEPWDVGMHGWRTGQFPPPFSEWNDRYRDTVRSYWLTDRARDAAGLGGHGVRDLATRVAGSADLFHARDRGTIASINFLAAHDGFTLHDLCAYNEKHNGMNAEDNRDGSNDNRSWNHGHEGPTLESQILTARRRTMRAMLGTLFVAAGVPMINGGDEFGRSQRGNNNPYNQNNDITWYDWDFEQWQKDLLDTTSFLAALRAAQPVLRQRNFFTGGVVHPDGSTDLAWYDGNGDPMENGRWENPHGRTLQMLFDGAPLGAESLLVVFHAGAMDGQVTLPTPPGLIGYELLWDSVWERPRTRADLALIAGGHEVTVRASTMHIYRVIDQT